VNAVFADTYFLIAVVNPSEREHRRALELAEAHTGEVVTTAWVLTEFADGLARSSHRGLFIQTLDSLRSDPRVTIVPPSPDLLEAGIDLYAARSDKQWSLTDCISFVVMQQRGIGDALTGDHHFEQAGFRALLA
jgi:uncharacterized protein